MNERFVPGQCHVLIVDDNPEDVRIYRRMLERLDSFACQVEDVSTGEGGLAFLAKHSVGCVLLDYRLPDMDGLEFLSELNRQQKLDVFPVILLTGQGDEHVAVQAMKSGAADYLIKGSLSGDLLLRAITHAVDQTSRRQEQKRYYAFLKILIDAVPNPLYFKGHAGFFSGCNKAFETLVGKSKSEIVGLTEYDLFSQDLARSFHALDEALFQDGSIQAREFTVPDANGRLLNMICYQASFQKIDRAQEGLVGILLDITAQKQTETELRQTQNELETVVAQLREANHQIVAQQKSVIEEERLKVLLELAGATAHELNQPLMALLSGIEQMRGQSQVDALQIERIGAAGSKVAEIIRRIQQIRHDEGMPCVDSDPMVRIKQPVTILSVEEDEKDFTYLKGVVEQVGNITLLRATSLKQALDLLHVNAVDMIIMEYKLPDGTGLDLMESLRQRELAIPAVVVAGQGNEVIASQSIRAGAYDYLPKLNLSVSAITRVVNNALERHRVKQEMKTMTERLARMATRDELTGLYNRHYFDESLPIEAEQAKRYGRPLTLAIFDLDHFKKVNDVYGHLAGDHVLRETGRCILRSIRRCDIACRYGGEEIAVIMPDTNCEDSLVTCERILDGIRSFPFEFEGKRFTVTASAGVAAYDTESEAPLDQFVQAVDRLLYQAKAAGRDRVVADEHA